MYMYFSQVCNSETPLKTVNKMWNLSSAPKQFINLSLNTSLEIVTQGMAEAPLNYAHICSINKILKAKAI